MSSSSKYYPNVETFGLRPITIIVCGCLLIYIAVLALSLRIYSRVYVTKTFGKDDWLLLSAFALYVADCGVFFRMAVLDVTRGIVRPADTPNGLAVAFFSIYIVNQILLKLSLCTFFLPIIQQRWHRLALIAAVIVYTLYAAFVLFFFFGLFGCGHNSSTMCVVSQHTIIQLIRAHAVLNAFMDWVFVLVPVLIVVRTSMPTRTKLSVCFVLLFAALGSVVSVIRIPFIGTPLGMGSWYFTMEGKLSLLSIVETGLGVICLSVAALKPMFREIARKVASVLSSSHASDGSSVPGFSNMNRAEDGTAGGEQMQQRPATADCTGQAIGRSSLVVERTDQPRRVDSAGMERLKEAQENGAKI